MGRRLRGAALRASKRIKLSEKESTEVKADLVETQEFEEKRDDELFVIDTTAVLPSRKQQQKKQVKAKDPRKNPSLKEQAQIEKLMQLHSPNQLQELVAKGKISSHVAVRKGSVQPNFDLWGSEDSKQQDETTLSTKKRKAVVDPVIGSTLAGIKPATHVEIVSRPALPPPHAKTKTVTVEVAKAGQSYNPDKVLHTKVLQEAVLVEQKRQMAEKEAKAPISTGMSAETKAYIVGSDSEDSDDDEDQETQDKDLNLSRPVEKIPKKLTKAERNKQKRIRAEQREIENRKRQKKLQNAVAEAKLISKQLTREEIEQNKRREELEKLKSENTRTKGADVYHRLAEENPINAPTYPVALRSELKQTGSSLRVIKPKGSLLTDRMISLTDRDMAAKKQLKKRTRVEGKRRKMKMKVRGKGYAESKESEILG